MTASALSAVATTVLTITNFMGVTFMEKLGRRTWLIAGAIGQTIFMATFTGLMSSPGAKTGAAAAAMLFGWIAVFGPTWGKHKPFPLPQTTTYLVARDTCMK